MHIDHEFSAEEHHRRGLALLGNDHGPAAFEHLSRAYLADPQNAKYRSSYALALGLVRRQFLGAIELARGALRQEFYNPELYSNLAQIYLAFGFKADAIRFLRRGLMVDPDHELLHRRLADLGVRRRPPLLFLPRNHRVNQWLGRVRARFSRPEPIDLMRDPQSA